MNVIIKKPYEEFLMTVQFEDRFEILETIDSFAVVCIDLLTNIDVSSVLLFFEDSVYQATDVAYGEGRYGGIADNLLSSITFGIRSGIVGRKYKITVKVITNIGSDYEEDIILELVENIDDYFTKQPSEKFVIQANYGSVINNEDVRYDDIINSEAVVATRKIDSAVVTGSVILSSAVDSKDTVVIRVDDGVDGNNYQITNKIVSFCGYKYQMDVLMSVKEK